jgi:serine/threonine-protein kinase HipA
MALNLYGRANRLSRTHFLDAATRLGLRERATSRMIDDVVAAAREWPDRCAEIGFPQRDTESLCDLMKSRIDTLT